MTFFQLGPTRGQWLEQITDYQPIEGITSERHLRLQNFTWSSVFGYIEIKG